MFRAWRILIAAVAALVLTACGGSPEPSASESASPSPSPSESATPTPTPTPTIPATDSLAGITVTGKRLEAPKVEFDTPLRIDQTRFEVVEPGGGPKAAADGLVTVHYYGVNARTGEVFDESFAEGDPVTFRLDQVIAGFQKGLTGQQPGSRMLIAVPGEDGYDESYRISPDYAPEGYELFDTLLFVVDIVDVSLTEPSGTAVTPPAGLPTVSPGTGKPTVTIPATAAPGSMVAQTLIEGTGREVEAGDAILARYVGYSWQTGEIFDDGFETPTSEQLANLIPGWTKGLEGRTVGSRVLLVLPPADGFSEGANNPPVEKGDTVVYVVDLLFAYSS